MASRQTKPRPRGRLVLRDSDVTVVSDGEEIPRCENREISILVATEALTLTRALYSAREQVAGPHIHHEHTDAFYVLEGELSIIARVMDQTLQSEASNRPRQPGAAVRSPIPPGGASPCRPARYSFREGYSGLSHVGNRGEAGRLPDADRQWGRLQAQAPLCPRIPPQRVERIASRAPPVTPAEKPTRRRPHWQPMPYGQLRLKALESQYPNRTTRLRAHSSVVDEQGR